MVSLDFWGISYIIYPYVYREGTDRDRENKMSDKDWTDLGNNIRDMVDDAVKSQDFRRAE